MHEFRQSMTVPTTVFTPLAKRGYPSFFGSASISITSHLSSDTHGAIALSEIKIEQEILTISSVLPFSFFDIDILVLSSGELCTHRSASRSYWWMMSLALFWSSKPRLIKVGIGAKGYRWTTFPCSTKDLIVLAKFWMGVPCWSLNGISAMIIS